MCTPDGEPIRATGGFRAVPDHGPEILDQADTVIVPGIHGDVLRPHPHLDPVEAAALARVPRHTRLVSICTGAFALAAAGRLDGRPATTHWRTPSASAGTSPRCGWIRTSPSWTTVTC